MIKNTRGFTLVEVLLVVGVIAVLAVITVISYNGTQARARDAKRKTDITAIAKALELYYDDNGQYPPSANGSTMISSSWSLSADASWTPFGNIMNGAIDSLPVDPRNNGGPLWAGNYGYAYFTGGYCGKTSQQWYLLVYRYESAPKEQTTDGTCATNPLGESYYASGASFYRSLK